jgi:WD40 repeat protein
VLWPERFIRQVGLHTGRPVGPRAGHRGQVQAVAYAPDGRTLATGSTDDTIRFWDASSCKEVRRFAARQLYVCSLAYSPDGKLLASAGYNSPELCLWDAATGTELRRWRAHRSPVRKIYFSPDGKLLASRCVPLQPTQTDRSLKLWDVRTGQEIRRFAVADRGPVKSDLAFSPDGKRLFAADGYATRAWDTGTGRKLPCLFRSARLLALAPAGRSMIAVAERPEDRSGAAVPGAAKAPAFALWEVSTGKERLHFDGIPRESLNCFIFSPDGRVVAGGGCGGTRVFLWDTRTGKRLAVLEGHDNWIMDLAFAPDGKALASASYDTTVLIWDVVGRVLSPGARATLSAADLARRWEDLADADGFTAYGAIQDLARLPQRSVPLLRKLLHPVPGTVRRAIAKHVQELDSVRFADRARATRALEALGELAAPQLETALRRADSLEVRRRVEVLLRKVRGPVRQPGLRRSIRAVEALEHIGNREARAVLRSPAGGAPEARLTCEGREALARLARRP